MKMQFIKTKLKIQSTKYIYTDRIEYTKYKIQMMSSGQQQQRPLLRMHHKNTIIKKSIGGVIWCISSFTIKIIIMLLLTMKAITPNIATSVGVHLSMLHLVLILLDIRVIWKTALA